MNKCVSHVHPNGQKCVACVSHPLSAAPIQPEPVKVKAKVFPLCCLVLSLSQVCAPSVQNVVHVGMPPECSQNAITFNAEAYCMATVKTDGGRLMSKRTVVTQCDSATPRADVQIVRITVQCRIHAF